MKALDVDDLLERLRTSDPAIWIDRVGDGELRAAAKALDEVPAARRGPLHGLAFAVKDNIDVAGRPTSAGLPRAPYVATSTAPAVKRLVAAGALLVGKTNLDQLATGLVGTRSPYGTPVNPLAADRIPGGSSSGSAVAVARDLVAFAIGTDTAGSGRVPAACVGIAGVKAAPGEVTTDGVVPASPSADCMSVFAADAADALAVHAVLAGRRWPSAAGPFTLGAPDPASLGTAEPAFADAFAADGAVLRRAGHRVVGVDLDPFFAAGDLLYGSALLAERTAAVADLVGRPLERALLDPVVCEVLERGLRFSAVEAFDAQRRLVMLRREVDRYWAELDALVVPSVPFVPTLGDVASDPVGVNERLGRFTTFVNPLGLAAVTVPTGHDCGRLLSSTTVVGPAAHAGVLRSLAADLSGSSGDVAPEDDAAFDVAVVGAHLRGEPLNGALTERGATFVASTTTAACYRLHHLAGGEPARPALERVATGGRPIDVEVWRLSAAALGALVADVPPPLGIGTVELDGGRCVKGFICEPHGLAGARDITSFGGWRRYRRAGL